MMHYGSPSVRLQNTLRGVPIFDKLMYCKACHLDRARSTSLLGFDACQFFDLETAGDHRLSWIFEASRARGFVLRSQELQILSFIWEIQYPNLID
ncbi:hypothetical protein Tco_1301910 [Tanacetum coccineum]